MLQFGPAVRKKTGAGPVSVSLSVLTVTGIADLTPVAGTKTIPVEFEPTDHDLAIEFRFPN